MSDPTEPRKSSLDEEMLKALEAAEAGDSSPLLDDGFLADTTFLDDNTPLVRKRDEEQMASPAAIAPRLRAGMPPHRTLDPRLRRRAAKLRSKMAQSETATRSGEEVPATTLNTGSSTSTPIENTAAPLDVDGMDPTIPDVVAGENMDAPPTIDNTTEVDPLPTDDHPTLVEIPPAIDTEPDVLPLSGMDVGQIDAPGDDVIEGAMLDEALTPTPSPESLKSLLADQTPVDINHDVLPEDALTSTRSPEIVEEILEDHSPEEDETDANSEEKEPPLPSESEPMLEEDTEQPSPDEDGADAPLSQASLAALLAEVPVSDYETPEPPEETTEGVFSPEDIDALLDATAGEENGEVESLTDEDLDGLFNALDGNPTGAEIDESNLGAIDAMLTPTDDDQTLDGSQFDGPVVTDNPSDDADVSMRESSIDELMSDLGNLGEDTTPEADADEGDMGNISQDMIDSLIASAQLEASSERGAASQSEVGSENLAAAATAAPNDDGSDLLSQKDLDKLIEGSRASGTKPHHESEVLEADEIEVAPVAAMKSDHRLDNQGTRFRRPSALNNFVRENALRLVACLMVGALFTLSSGILMHLNRENRPGVDSAKEIAALEVAIARGREKLAAGDYPGVVTELEQPIAQALPSELRNDARYLQLEAKYLGFRGQWGDRAFDDLSAETDEIVETAGAHPRAPEALYWKARLYTKDQPITALEIYTNIFDHYESAASRDRMLLDAAQLALELDDPLTTYTYAQRLLSEYPASPWAGEAILAIGDANMKAGLVDDARTMYIRVAQDAQDTALGAKAVIRLGQLAYDTGQYSTAEAYLRDQLETTTTLEGNDEVYLLLAKTYRAENKLENARDMLNDLLTFFEDSELRPDAFIEYTQVLEALGERERALKTAQRGVLEFPNNHRILRNDGELQGLAGHPMEAARSLEAADRAGAADPGLLLSAARYFRTANLPDEAARAYARLKSKFAGSDESLAGGIEAAQLRFERGETEQALNDLKAMQAATQGTAHYLPALIATQTIYRDLGLTPHIKRTALEIVTEAVESETLAAAAIDLIDTGDLESAQAAIGKLDFNRLRPRTAHKLLMKEGGALLTVAPQRGLEKMEQAYFNYPDARTREDDQTLLQTYLDTGRAAAARRMVMDLRAHVDSSPIDTPYLIDAAIAWGDYLYSKEDFRTAVFAFSIAEDAAKESSTPVTGLRSDPSWARYQRANALLELADYEGCVSLFDDIATSDSPWAREAKFKASLARQEQQRRGAPDSQRAQAG